MGDWDTGSILEPLASAEFAVSRVIVHPNYNPINLQNNLAILKLATEVPLGTLPTISIACLPCKY